MWFIFKSYAIKSFLGVIILSLSDPYEASTTPEILPKYFVWSLLGKLEIVDNEINATQDTHFIVHGWKQSSDSPIFQEIARNYYVMDNDVNIILVDYEKLSAAPPSYADQIVAAVGSAFGEKIISLIQNQGLMPERIQIFGFSLGAHISGKAARHVARHVKKKIGRLTAADPLGPIFHDLKASVALTRRLTAADATMVDVTHTTYHPNITERYGTLDFYVQLINSHQPACVTWMLYGKPHLLITTCDHNMAAIYFAESILSCGFNAHETEDNEDSESLLYGQYVPKTATGLYFLSTNGKPPYAKSYNAYPKCKTTL